MFNKLFTIEYSFGAAASLKHMSMFVEPVVACERAEICFVEGIEQFR